MITLWLVGIVFLAILVEATAGFGATVVAVTLAAELMPIGKVLATLAPVNVILSAYVVVRHRHAVDTRLLLRRILPFMGAGMVVGISLFQLRGQGWLVLVFALFVVALSLSELWRARQHTLDASTRPPLPPAVAGGTLALAGVVHGLFACAGPLVVYVVGREVHDKRRFRSTLAALWLTLNTILIPSYVFAGQLDTHTLPTSAVLILPTIAAIWAGEQLHHRIPQHGFRIAVDVLLLFAGITLAIRSWPI